MNTIQYKRLSMSCNCLSANTCHPEGHLGRIRNSVTLLSRILKILLTRIRTYRSKQQLGDITSLQTLFLPLFFSVHVTQRLPNPPLQYRGNADHERHRLSLFYWRGKRTPQKHPLRNLCVSEYLNHSAIVLHSKYIVSLWQRSKCFDIKSNVVGI